jgi:murein DD-endopeptidase MepM/ murein hydrolase activator NlpD
VLRADQFHSKKFIEQVGIKAAALKRVESDRAALAALQAELRLQEASLRDTKARRLALLEDIRTERTLAEAALRQRRQAQEALTQRFAPETTGSSRGGSDGGGRQAPASSGSTSSRGGFRSQAGKLPWPTSGTLMRRFGKSVDPRTGATEKNAGIDIRAAFGTPFRAVADGVVQHNGYVPAFGMVVILQHGTYSSVYAHAGKTQVARGQSVRKGDVLGFVGETGVTDGEGPRLHFEIRYHQTPQDPMSWLAPRSRR